ncbi:MAG TPA: xanthine dehydrogenase family protein molybdopterin-binding subunit [Bauldia sp.]|nr:xanthine dehydrogenase family protein molybdopterin-binding subunit [Bauldia sp.]
MPVIGRSVRRLEDGPLLTGQGRFAADVSFPGQLHMRVVRSPLAHGRLLGVDASEALAMPGVTAVWTGADVSAIPPIDFRMTRVPGLSPYRQPILARDKVRYVGEPVAAVFAEDAYLAEDAAGLVFADIEDLPPVLDATAPPADFDDGRSTEPAVIRKGYGDVDAAFVAAHLVVELTLAVGRHTGSPLETRGALARVNSDTGVLEVHGAAKVPHANRKALAAQLGVPLELIHLYEGHVGGGFGIRGELYPEDVLVALAALRLGRPVKWIEDRREHLIAANHSRDQVHRIRAAVDGRGFILALDDEFFADQGAYVRTHAATVPDLTAAMLPGPYVIPAYRVAGHIRLTNKTPCGTYRAPGRYEGSFVRERLIDEIARRLGKDPVEVRRINLIPSAEMPYTRPLDALGTEVTLDSGDYAGLLDKALGLIRYDALRAEIARRRQAGELVGLGLGYFVEKSGLGPFDGVRIAVEPDGRIEVVTGAASVGQGVETVIGQVCADTLGVPIDIVRVVHGQTERIRDGMGAFASRVTVMTGSATHMAATELKEKILAHAGVLLQQPPEALAVADGVVAPKHAPAGASVTLAALAEAAEAQALAAEAWFNVSHMCYPYGIHAALVRVDRETGGVTVERLFIAYDVGRAVNPMLVAGQLLGGAAQGVGGALLEEFVYDETGQPLAASFADYLMPTATEMPPVALLVTEDARSPLNPLGVKGAGEGGITAVGAAIANAVDDALGRPGAATIGRLPLSPPRVLAAIRSLGL